MNLHRPFGNRALRRGARVELRLTHSGRIGRVLRFRIGSTPGEPSVDPLPAAVRIGDCWPLAGGSRAAR